MKKFVLFSICIINATYPFVDNYEIKRNIYHLFGENPRNCSQTAHTDIDRLSHHVKDNLDSIEYWLTYLLGQRTTEQQIKNAIFDIAPSFIRQIATEYLRTIYPNQSCNEAAVEEVVREIQFIINRNYSRRDLPEGLLGGYLGESLRRQLGNRAERVAQLLKERERQQYSQTPSHQGPIKIFDYEECCACLDKFNYQTVRPVILKCGHAAMCTACVKEWYTENSYRHKNFSCPICRKEMTSYEVKKSLYDVDKNMPYPSAPRY